MNPRIVTLPFLAVVVLLAGCGSLQRIGKDIAVVGTSPITVPLSAGYDSLDWGEDKDAMTPVLFFPVNFVLHTLKHVAYTVVYAGDLVVSPLYLIPSVFPGNDLAPIKLYYLDGYPWPSEPVPAFETQ